MSISIAGIVTKRDDNLASSIGDETLMMRIDSGRYYSIDGSGKAIWDAIDGPTPVESIIHLLTTRYEVDREPCELQTLAFLADLVEHNLIFYTEK